MNVDDVNDDLSKERKQTDQHIDISNDSNSSFEDFTEPKQTNEDSEV